MNIGLDMMGGDFAPLEAVRGIAGYLQAESEPAHLTLLGNKAQLELLLDEYKVPSSAFTIVDAGEVIGMHEHPTKALREKPDSSIAIGFRHLATGQMDAFLSAGNTGAMLVGALFSIKTIEGVIRPTISSVIPRAGGGSGLLLDVGLNADCKPEQLNQFAIMGSVYAQSVLGISRPRVALLNIGEEEGKGNMLAQAAYPLLKENKHIHFVGNVEGRDVLGDKADVMVCDGFTGNIVLKLAESLYNLGQDQQLNSPYLDRFNFEVYGGTPVLGVSKPVIIGHGISTALAFRNMIDVAQKMITTRVLDRMREELT